MTSSGPRLRARRRGHDVCPRCEATGTTHVVHHPSGTVVLCWVCGHVRLTVPGEGALHLPGMDDDPLAAPDDGVPLADPALDEPADLPSVPPRRLRSV